MTEPVINVQIYEPLIITANEYEKILHNLLMRQAVGDTNPGDRILARILFDNESRFHEVCLTTKTRYERKIFLDLN